MTEASGIRQMLACVMHCSGVQIHVTQHQSGLSSLGAYRAPSHPGSRLLLQLAEHVFLRLDLFHLLAQTWEDFLVDVATYNT